MCVCGGLDTYTVRTAVVQCCCLRCCCKNPCEDDGVAGKSRLLKTTAVKRFLFFVENTRL